MALNFPNNPTIGDIYTDTTSGFSYEWDGTVWQSYTASSSKNISIIDDISGSFNGTLDTFALAVSGTALTPANAQQLRIVLGGVVQEPLTDYTVSGSNITFTTPPTGGLTFSGVSLGPAVAVSVPGDGTVTPPKLSTGGPSWNGSGDVLVSGIVTASSFVGNLTGTATTATEATNFTVTANNSTNETVYPVFVDGATGTQGAETDTSLSYNPSTNILTAGTFSGSGSNLTSLNASNISSGTIGDAYLPATISSDITGNAATATDATNFTVSANNSTDETVYPVFVDGATGSQGAETDTSLSYNPSTNILTAGTFSGSGDNLTGISTNFVSAIGIQSAGVAIGAGITQLNFIGAGNTFAVDGTTVNISIAGGGGGGGELSISTNTTNQSQYLTYAVSTGSTTGLGVTTNDLVFNPSTVRLGIGTNNPQNTLQIEGELLISAGSASSTHVIQKAYEDNSGSISWEGTSGQLFSITNNLTSGSLFNVTNISGIPYLDVNADGSVQLSPYANGNVSVGATSAPTTLYLNGTAASNVVELGNISTNTALDFSSGNNFSMTLTGSIVLLNPTGVTTGQSGIIQIQQDGTGNRTCGFSSHWDFPSATVPTLSTGADALDCITYFVRNSTSIIANSLIGIGTI